MKPDDTIEIRQDVGYYIHPKHRGSPTKGTSTWTVSVDDEVKLFKRAIPTVCSPGQTYWAAVAHGQRLRIVGKNVHGEFLKFGKFVGEPAITVWHGYPADYRRNTRDRPPITVLKAWVAQGLLEKHHIAKISGGKRCNL